MAHPNRQNIQQTQTPAVEYVQHSAYRLWGICLAERASVARAKSIGKHLCSFTTSIFLMHCNYIIKQLPYCHTSVLRIII